MPRTRVTCACGARSRKGAYRTPEAAGQALETIRGFGGYPYAQGRDRRWVPQVVYGPCPEGVWHLSGKSRTKAKTLAARRRRDAVRRARVPHRAVNSAKRRALAAAHAAGGHAEETRSRCRDCSRA